MCVLDLDSSMHILWLFIIMRINIYICVCGELQISLNIEGHQILAMHSYDVMYSFLLATHMQTNTLAQPDYYDYDLLWGSSPFLC